MKSRNDSKPPNSENPQPTYGEIAKFLGLPGSHPLPKEEMTNLFSRGFPVDALDRVAHAIYPDDPKFTESIIGTAPISFAKEDEQLITRSSHLVYRLASIWLMALRGLQDEEMARSFLHSPNPLLFDEVPLDLTLRSQEGMNRVTGLLSSYGPSIQPVAYWKDEFAF